MQNGSQRLKGILPLHDEMTINSETDLEWRGIDYLFLLALVAMNAAVYTLSVLPRTDIGPCDDMTYSLAGELWPNVRLLPNWAPLYSLWHALVLTLVPDRVDAYFLSAAVLSAVMPALLFLVLRGLRGNRTLSVATAIITATSHSILSECPKVQVFAAIVLMAALSYVLYRASPARAEILLALSLLVGAYIRPELAVALLCFILFLIFRWVSGRLAAAPVAILLVLFMSGFAYYWIGSPFNDSRYNRSVEAFGLLFAKASGVVGEDRLYEEWSHVVLRQYGTTPAILDAFVSDPIVTARAVGKNILDIGPAAVVANRGVGGSLHVVALGAILCAWLLQGSRRDFLFGESLDSSLVRGWTFSVVLCGIIPFGVALIFPRHLFFLQVFLVLFVAAGGAPWPRLVENRILSLIALVASLVQLAGIGTVEIRPESKPNLRVFRTFQREVAARAGAIYACPSFFNGFFTTSEFARRRSDCSSNAADTPVRIGLFGEGCDDVIQCRSIEPGSWAPCDVGGDPRVRCWSAPDTSMKSP